MKTFLATAKTATKWILRLNVVAMIYVLVALTFTKWYLPIPASTNPEFLAKLLAITSGCLTALVAELKWILDIELFSGPEVAAIGYEINFCKGVAAREGKELYPCYIFIPESLSEIDSGRLSN